MMGEMVLTRNSFLRNSHPALELRFDEETPQMRCGESSAVGEAVGKVSEKSLLPTPQVRHKELTGSQYGQESRTGPPAWARAGYSLSTSFSLSPMSFLVSIIT